MPSLPDLHKLNEPSTSFNDKSKGSFFRNVPQNEAIMLPFPSRAGDQNADSRQIHRLQPHNSDCNKPHSPFIRQQIETPVAQSSNTSPSTSCQLPSSHLRPQQHNASLAAQLNQCGSTNSSTGASSVHRLIAIVCSTPGHMGPIYCRHILYKNYAALYLSHCMFTAAFVPLLALQGSISAWWWPSKDLNEFKNFDSDAGSLLLCSLFALASLSTLSASYIIARLGVNWCLTWCYTIACIFLGVHLYPVSYLLIPSYLLMGLSMGPLALARVHFLMILSSKLFLLSENEEQVPTIAHQVTPVETVLRRLNRGFQFFQDLGLVIGNLLAAVLLWYNMPNIDTNGEQRAPKMFEVGGDGEYVCGSAACPFQDITNRMPYQDNSTSPLPLLCKTSTVLASVFLGFCVMSLALTAAFVDNIVFNRGPRIKKHFSDAAKMIQNTFKDSKMQLAIPLSLFIGLEQGFLYSDFGKSYVMCSKGLSDICLVFLSLGMLQTIAFLTLSLVLPHISRCFVIVIGFLFHSCLLLVLMRWKPTVDDPALFYVITAAWGVCDAIWDVLSFTHITIRYPDTWEGPIALSYCYRYMGLALSFGLHGFLCNWIKLLGLTVALLAAVVPYTWLEIMLSCETNLSYTIANEIPMV